MKGFILFLVALVLGIILVPAGMLFGFFKNIRHLEIKKAITDIDTKFLNMAVSVDKFGNVVCAELFNATLIKRSKHLFGNHRQTVSHVLGVNVRSRNLTKTGESLNNLLNIFEKDHSVKSIEE